MKLHLIFDIEIIGDKDPVFLVCVKCVEKGWVQAFWLHKPGHMALLEIMLNEPTYTWVSFNGINFDTPLICAALQGADALRLKRISNQIIEEQLRSWQSYQMFAIDPIEFDHIDLIETAPGVMISLKTYAGRMGYKSMVDMPFDHTQDLSEADLPTLEAYCVNDLDVTEALFKTLSKEIALRIELSAKHGVDLRSKSDAQAAEAILKQALAIPKASKEIPQFVRYTTPALIRTFDPQLRELIAQLEQTKFKINSKNGSPEVPDWLGGRGAVRIGEGTYQMGIGGLHSTHDLALHVEANDDLLISDFDVASYYPNLMMKCGLIPRLPGGMGDQFLDVYGEIYRQRLDAKHAAQTIQKEIAEIERMLDA